MESDNDEQDQQNDEELQRYEAFLRQKDAVMEPKVWDTVVGYIQAGGVPETVVEVLTENYVGYAQMACLVCKWLQVLEEREHPEPSSSTATTTFDPFHFLQQLIKQKFNADKFAGLFAKGGSGPPDWLYELINDRRGRQLVYELSAQHENCLLFNFAIQKILAQGHEDELATMGSSLASYFGVYHRLLAAKLKQAARAGPADFEALTEELQSSCSTSQHTYCHTQQLLTGLSRLDQGHLFARLSQQVEAATAHQHPAAWRMRTFFLPAARSQDEEAALQLVGNLLVDSPPLRLQDVRVLAKLYTKEPLPPVAPLRHPQLLRLLTSHAFAPPQAAGSGGSQELRDVCCDLLALAAAADSSPAGTTPTPTPTAAGPGRPSSPPGATATEMNTDTELPPGGPSPHSVPHTRLCLQQAQAVLTSLAQGGSLDEQAAAGAVEAPAACCGLLHYMRGALGGKDVAGEGLAALGTLGKSCMALLQMVGQQQPHLLLQVLDLTLSVLCHTASAAPAAAAAAASSTSGRQPPLSLALKRWVELLLLPLEAGWVIETLEAVVAKAPSLDRSCLAHFLLLLAARTVAPFSQEFKELAGKLLRLFGNVRHEPLFGGYSRGLMMELAAACHGGGAGPAGQ